MDEDCVGENDVPAGSTALRRGDARPRDPHTGLEAGAGLLTQSAAPVDRNMYVAVCQLTARIYGSRSLKDKRRVVQSLKERARKRFGASVSEVGQQEKWQIAVLGVAITSGEATHARQQLDALIRYVEEFSPELEVTGSESDVFSFGD